MKTGVSARMDGETIVDIPEEHFRTGFGRRVREVRNYYRYTTEQLAGMAGVSTQFLSDVERGKKSMTALNVLRLANALHVSTDFLLQGSDDLDRARMIAVEQLATLRPADRDMSIELLGLTLRLIEETKPR